jgi:DNA-binding NarL/FixJ family response regulator
MTTPVRIYVFDDHFTHGAQLRVDIEGDHRFRLMARTIDVSPISTPSGSPLPGDVVIADPATSVRPTLPELTSWAQTGVTIVLHTELMNAALAREALDNGYRAYGFKRSDAHSRALDAIWMAGICSFVVYEPEILALATHLREGSASRTSRSLTPRESDILSLMAEGRSDQEIARLKSIALSTVETHVSHIYRKLGASNRFECALLAVRHGLIHVASIPEL